MTGTKRKPFNGDAGYVCMANAPFGYVVVYDRENGGGWIDAESRWLVVAYNKGQGQISMIEANSLRDAREVMKSARAGFHDWLDEAREDIAKDVA